MLSLAALPSEKRRRGVEGSVRVLGTSTSIVSCRRAGTALVNEVHGFLAAGPSCVLLTQDK